MWCVVSTDCNCTVSQIYCLLHLPIRRDSCPLHSTPPLSTLLLLQHPIPLGHHNPPLSHHSLPLGHPSLPLGHHSLPLGHHSLPLGHCSLPLSHHSLPLSHHSLPLSHHSLPLTKVSGHQHSLTTPTHLHPSGVHTPHTDCVSTERRGSGVVQCELVGNMEM